MLDFLLSVLILLGQALTDVFRSSTTMMLIKPLYSISVYVEDPMAPFSLPIAVLYSALMSAELCLPFSISGKESSLILPGRSILSPVVPGDGCVQSLSILPLVKHFLMNYVRCLTSAEPRGTGHTCSSRSIPSCSITGTTTFTPPYLSE